MNISFTNNTSLSSLWGSSSKSFSVSTSSKDANSTESANNTSSSLSSQKEQLRILKKVSEDETTLENGDGDTAQISNSGMMAASMPPGPPPSESGNSDSTTDTSEQNIEELLNSDDDSDDDDDDSLQAILERVSNGTADAADLQRLEMLLEQKGLQKANSAGKESADNVNKTKNNLDSKTIDNDDLAKDEYLKKTIQDLPLESYSKMKNYSQYSHAANYNYTA